jgi:hypothetical protein
MRILLRSKIPVIFLKVIEDLRGMGVCVKNRLFEQVSDLNFFSYVLLYAMQHTKGKGGISLEYSRIGELGIHP